jgi:uncharacterized protein
MRSDTGPAVVAKHGPSGRIAAPAPSTLFRANLEKTTMLELRPTCENCNRDLPPDCTDAMICTFECTFCRTCVDNVLENVCPNCGGGFCSRPVRPFSNWKGDYYLGAYPASTAIKHRPVKADHHRAFADAIKFVPPNLR